VSIVPVVEGHGEVEAVPVLLRRLLATLGCALGVAKPFRVKRDAVVRPGELERAVQLAIADRDGAVAVLVLLDSDDDDPGALAPMLQARVNAVTALPSTVVLAVREFESWFLAGKESLRGACGIRGDAVAPDNCEALRDGKGHLSANMLHGRRYLPVDDQPSLSARLDINLARQRSASFERFCAEVSRLCAELT
jgi:hypothetical protein